MARVQKVSRKMRTMKVRLEVGSSGGGGKKSNGNNRGIPNDDAMAANS